MVWTFLYILKIILQSSVITTDLLFHTKLHLKVNVQYLNLPYNSLDHSSALAHQKLRAPWISLLFWRKEASATKMVPSAVEIFCSIAGRVLFSHFVAQLCDSLTPRLKPVTVPSWFLSQRWKRCRPCGCAHCVLVAVRIKPLYRRKW